MLNLYGTIGKVGIIQKEIMHYISKDKCILAVNDRVIPVFRNLCIFCSKAKQSELTNAPEVHLNKTQIGNF